MNCLFELRPIIGVVNGQDVVEPSLQLLEPFAKVHAPEARRHAPVMTTADVREQLDFAIEFG